MDYQFTATGIGERGIRGYSHAHPINDPFYPSPHVPPPLPQTPVGGRREVKVIVFYGLVTSAASACNSTDAVRMNHRSPLPVSPAPGSMATLSH